LVITESHRKDPYFYSPKTTTNQHVMKEIVLCSLWVFCGWKANAQDSLYNPTAILILDRMSNVISDMTSCSFKTVASHDEADPEFGLIKRFVNTQVYMAGPDKMVVNYWGAKGHRQCWYDGKEFAIYDYEERNYGIVAAPPTIIATIDSIHTHYGLDFPAADFFYPAFTDDLIESNDRIEYKGQAIIDGQECFHIIAQSKSMTSQIWIRNDAYNLPVKYVITYNTKSGHPQYEATYSEWEVNPDIPNAVFKFLPPPGTHQVRLVSQKEK